MTKEKRTRLAKAARELAMDVVKGTAPDFGCLFEFSEGKPHCANGHVVARAGYTSATSTRGWRSYWDVATYNDVTKQRAGLPWALLSLADEIEAYDFGAVGQWR